MTTKPSLNPTAPGLPTRIGNSLKFWGFRFISWLAGHVPVWFSYWVGGRVADFIYTFWHEHSGNAVSNMARVLGPTATSAQVRRAARLSFQNYILVLVDFVRIPYLKVEAIEREMQASGMEYLEAARARGKGVILVACHSGNWDFGGAVLSRYSLPITAVADMFEPPRLNEYVIAMRKQMGVNTIPADPAALRKLFEALRRNEIVMLFVDRPVPGDGVAVQFFGETAWVPPGPAAIALKTGATIVPGYFIRQPNGRSWRGAFDPPIPVTPTGNKERDTATVTQAIMDYMEAVIRRSPAQWYMFRPMWERVTLGSRWQRGPALANLSMGISVDPPIIEDWASGGAPGDAPVPTPPERVNSEQLTVDGGR